MATMHPQVPRRRGRPPSGQADAAVRFQMALADLERIDAAAAQRGLTRSDVLRWCLRRGMRQLAELPARRPTPYGVEAPSEKAG